MVLNLFERDLLVLSTNPRCTGIQNNSNGTRLMFKEAEGPTVIDLSAFKSSVETEGKKMLPTPAEEENRNWIENGSCCFAGRNDELYEFIISVFFVIFKDLCC